MDNSDRRHSTVRVDSPSRCYRFHGLALRSDIELPEVPRAAPQSGDVTIELAGEPVNQPRQRSRTGDIGIAGRPTRRRPWLSVARGDDGYLLRFQRLADFEISPGGDRICCRPASRLAKSTLRHLLLDQVLPLALSQHGNLVLHASVVHVPRVGAVAFVGRAGYGKSTLAAALGVRGCPVVADDSLVLARGARPFALPGYPGLRLWRRTARALGLQGDAQEPVAHYTAKRRLMMNVVSFRARPSPVRALFVLGRRLPIGQPTRSRTLQARDRLMALAPYACVMDVTDRRQLSQMFSELSQLVTEVPVVRLRLGEKRKLLDCADDVLALTRTLAIR